MSGANLGHPHLERTMRSTELVLYTMLLLLLLLLRLPLRRRRLLVPFTIYLLHTITLRHQSASQSLANDEPNALRFRETVAENRRESATTRRARENALIGGWGTAAHWPLQQQQQQRRRRRRRRRHIDRRLQTTGTSGPVHCRGWQLGARARFYVRGANPTGYRRATVAALLRDDSVDVARREGHQRSELTRLTVWHIVR